MQVCYKICRNTQNVKICSEHALQLLLVWLLIACYLFFNQKFSIPMKKLQTRVPLYM